MPAPVLGRATPEGLRLARNSDNKAIGFLKFLRLDAASRMGDSRRRMVVPVRMALFHAHHSRPVAAAQEDSAALAGSTRAGCQQRRARRDSEDTHAS